MTLLASLASATRIKVDDQFVGSDGNPMRNVHYLGISAGRIGEVVGLIKDADLIGFPLRVVIGGKGLAAKVASPEF